MTDTNTVKAGERTQFAPAPWSVDGENVHHGPIIAAANGSDIAQVFGSGKDERAATAKLITAAPDMLETLKLILYMTASTDTVHRMAEKSIRLAGGEIVEGK